MKLSSFLFKSTPANNVSDIEIDEIKPVEIIEISTTAIVPNPFQPRKTFSDENLNELASSIREIGVIQPLLVREVEAGYELIAGERRLRASMIAGLLNVPCIVRNVNDKEMAEIALIENLQREDLHFFEEAIGYEKLLTLFDLTQEVLAKRVGKNQSTIANKLRLLKISLPVRALLLAGGLSERHSRAILKIESEQQQMAVVEKIIEAKMTVKETEAYIAALRSPVDANNDKPKRPTFLRIVKDARIFINTIGELVKQMNKAGLAVEVSQCQDENFVTITMIVPKRK